MSVPTAIASLGPARSYHRKVVPHVQLDFYADEVSHTVVCI